MLVEPSPHHLRPLRASASLLLGLACACSSDADADGPSAGVDASADGADATSEGGPDGGLDSKTDVSADSPPDAVGEAGSDSESDSTAEGGAPVERCTEVQIVSPAPRATAAASSASCTGCDDEGRVTITFRFDKDVPCGRFVDGSPWVADEGGGVRIEQILPAVTADCGADTCNGWMVDVSSRSQALDARKNFDASVAPPVRNPSEQEPFVAQAGMSILKAVSFQDEIVGADCSNAAVLGSEPRHCLYFGAVLTVLDEPPPDGTGAGYFRPGYAAGQRELIPVSDADFDLLPKLPLAGISDGPERDVAESDLCMTELSFMGGYTSELFKAYLNVGEARGYNGYTARRLGDNLLRALFEDRTDRMAACVVQRGIDIHQMLLPPLNGAWEPNGGHGLGRMLWPYLAAALLSRPDWVDEINAMPRLRFAERSQIYYSPVADPSGNRGEPGEILYGSHPGAGGLSQCTASHYLDNCYPDWPGGCNRICADPFGFIDGGNPGTSYQAIFSPLIRPFALTARLVPSVDAVWPRDDGHALLLDYADRWVEFGAWAAPDSCDAANPLSSSSPPQCTSGPIGTCLCNPGGGRYVDRHGTAADGGSAYRSSYASAVWSAFRGCADGCACDGMSGLCP